MAEQKIDKSVLITGIICITALEMVAITMGFNGKLLAGSIGVIAVAIGVSIPSNIISQIFKHIRIVK